MISHTGTNFHNSKWVNDIKSDLAIMWGLKKQDQRFKHAKSHLKKVKSKYGDKNLTITGHSLGGAITEQLARSNPNIKGIAFNRGAGLLQAFRERPQSFIDISNRNDPISYFARASGGKRCQNMNKNKGWHSI